MLAGLDSWMELSTMTQFLSRLLMFRGGNVGWAQLASLPTRQKRAGLVRVFNPQSVLSRPKVGSKWAILAGPPFFFWAG